MERASHYPESEPLILIQVHLSGDRVSLCVKWGKSYRVLGVKIMCMQTWHLSQKAARPWQLLSLTQC